MIVSARTLRSLNPWPRHALDERVEMCGVCAEATPHARVIRGRPFFVIVALMSSALLVVLPKAQPIYLIFSAAALIAIWFVLRRRDRRRSAQCVRCLDRPRREGGIYLIDLVS